MQCAWCNKYVNEGSDAGYYSYADKRFCSQRCKLAYEKAVKDGKLPDPHSGCSYIVGLIIGIFFIITIIAGAIFSLISKKNKKEREQAELETTISKKKDTKDSSRHKNKTTISDSKDKSTEEETVMPEEEDVEEETTQIEWTTEEDI